MSSFALCPRCYLPPVPAALLVNLLTCHPISCLCRCAGLLLLGVIKVHNLTIYSFPAVSGARVPGHQSPHSHTQGWWPQLWGDGKYVAYFRSIAHQCMKFLNICSLISQWQCQLPLKVLNGSFILADWCKMRRGACLRDGCWETVGTI